MVRASELLVPTAKWCIYERSRFNHLISDVSQELEALDRHFPVVKAAQIECARREAELLT